MDFRLGRNTLIITLAAWMMAVPVAPCFSQSPETPISISPGVAKLREKGIEGSITIFPFSLPGKPDDSLAPHLGLLLEMLGLEKNALAETKVEIPREANLFQTLDIFSAALKRQSIDTDFAICVEPRSDSGSTEVNQVIMMIHDKEGNRLWFDDQRPGHYHFDLFKPQLPFSLCHLVAERLRTQFDLPSGISMEELMPVIRAQKGPMARFWAKRIGMPSTEEQALMEERLVRLAIADPSVKVVIHPVRIGSKNDREAAADVVRHLNSRQTCDARVGEELPGFPVKGDDPLKRRWDIAKLFRHYVRTTPPKADYAVYIEFFGSPADARVIAAHFVICDQKGEWVKAVVDMQNEYQLRMTAKRPEIRAEASEEVADWLDELIVK